MDQDFRELRYTFDRTRSTATREVVGDIRSVVPVENARLDVPSHENVFVHAVLASSSIPIVNPPVLLGEETPLPAVDAGIRDAMPIQQALDILDHELAPAMGRKGVIAIGTGVLNPEASEPLLGELLPPPFEIGDYPLASIGVRALGTMVDEIYSDEFRQVIGRLPDGVDHLVIMPSFNLGAGTELDPGLVQINMSYGWMTAYDRVQQYSGARR